MLKLKKKSLQPDSHLESSFDESEYYPRKPMFPLSGLQEVDLFFQAEAGSLQMA
jgi:hypothetical protein